MKSRGLLLGFIAFSFLGFLLFGSQQSKGTLAADGERNRKIQLNIAQYVWQVVSNQTGKTLCEVTIEYNRQPSSDEIMAACASYLNPAPQATQAADATPIPTPVTYTQAQFLQTVRLNFLREDHFTRTVTITMQKMTTSLDLPDKTLLEPYIVLTAYEPEPDYTISAIRGQFNGNDFFCNVSQCRIPVTRDSNLEFWAVSSFGDESEHVRATIRILSQPGGSTLTIDSISPVQLFADSCSQIWGTPVTSPPPEWAAFPSSPAYLNTNKKYYYLAGKLISTRLVDASACPGGGLFSDGSPNACGMEKAAPEMIRWQNQYDTMAWATGRDVGIPPAIVKTLIEVESQFWPANIRYFMYEFGLAQINQYGADVALRWDNDLYKQICSGLYYDCSLAYASQPLSIQATLRGGLVRSINSDCPTCKNGIDFAKAVESVPSISRVLKSNCRQAKFIFDQNNVKPRYEDAWKFTLVSYHSGYSCLDDAIRATSLAGLEVTWENVSQKISPFCFGGADYVNEFWKSLITFPTYRIKPDLSPKQVALAEFVQTPTPIVTPTQERANSKIRVMAYIDKNQNNQQDADEGVDALLVNIVVSNGKALSQKTIQGMTVFDMAGFDINASAVVSLPTQFLAKSILVQATGEMQVVFQLQQAPVPPVLP